MCKECYKNVSPKNRVVNRETVSIWVLQLGTHICSAIAQEWEQPHITYIVDFSALSPILIDALNKNGIRTN